MLGSTHICRFITPLLVRTQATINSAFQECELGLCRAALASCTSTETGGREIAAEACSHVDSRFARQRKLQNESVENGGSLDKCLTCEVVFVPHYTVETFTQVCIYSSLCECGSGVHKHFTASKLQYLPTEMFPHWREYYDLSCFAESQTHVPVWNWGLNTLNKSISAHFQYNRWGGISTKFGRMWFWTWQSSKVRDCLMWNSFPNAEIQKTRSAVTPH